MMEVYLKYNPYTLETILTIDGEVPKQGTTSSLNKVYGSRLQDWVEELPQMLFDEYCTRTFNVTFHGTIMDFEDLESILDYANKNAGFKFTWKHEAGQEIAEKEKAIKNIFSEIQKGPFEELRTQALKEKFEETLSEDFKVNVMATMSSGKSTLVNALLGQKLMPASQEACTAIVTELKDDDKEPFSATAYDKDGNKIKDYEKLSLEIMSDLNSNVNVRNIKAVGDIPFTNSEEIALVIVDTPGPNNSRNKEHGKVTYQLIDGETKAKPPLILYILNADQLGITDDNNLLNTVAERMSVGGKQSKDRFLFVVNKLDNFKKGEDSVSASLDKVRTYLSEKGIENPNIFPASALTALNIRTIMNGVNVVGYDEDELEDMDEEIQECITKIKKFCKNEEMYLEKHASVTPSVKMKLNADLEELYKQTEKTNSDEVRSEAMKQIALIHSGVIPLERAIDMYVRKYAKTAKIKSMIDSFIGTLEDTKVQAETETKIAEKIKEGDEIAKQIEKIEAQISDGNRAKEFNKEIDNIKFDVSFIDKLNLTVQQKIAKEQMRLGEEYRKEINIKEAISVEKDLKKFALDLQASVYHEIERKIKDNIEGQGCLLLDKYKNSLKSLVNDLNVGNIELNPYNLVKGTLDTINIQSLVQVKEVSEKVWVENTNKKWYKPWTWFDDDGYYETQTRSESYILFDDLLRKRLSPLEVEIARNCKSAKEYAIEESKRIKEIFKQEFAKLNDLLQSKYAALKCCAENKENIEAMQRDLESKLNWIEEIKHKIDDVLKV